MFGIGGFELFIIVIFAFLIVGPDKLPEVARTVGKGIARFRQAQEDMAATIKEENILNVNKVDSAPKSSTASDQETKQESFSERRARYEQEKSAADSSSAGGDK